MALTLVADAGENAHGSRRFDSDAASRVSASGINAARTGRLHHQDGADAAVDPLGAQAFFFLLCFLVVGQFQGFFQTFFISAAVIERAGDIAIGEGLRWYEIFIPQLDRVELELRAIISTMRSMT